MWIGSGFRAVQLKREADRLAQGYKGSRSRPRSASTTIMGAGLLLAAGGFFLLRPQIMIAGAGVFVLGLLLALVELLVSR